ncbi:MAG: hypothetical protein HYY50_00745 [Candidatus Kerfeldbacteria bacterium]|nr:hypothetical protein [Candidatus Kerfeldbacteria bacterium]
MRIGVSSSVNERVWRMTERERYLDWREGLRARIESIINVFNVLHHRRIHPVPALIDATRGPGASISSHPVHEYSLLAWRGPTLTAMRADPDRPVSVSIAFGWVPVEPRREITIEIPTSWRNRYRLYIASNFIVWHELAHLVETDLIERLLLEAGIVEFGDTSGPFLQLASEVVIDSLALLFGTTWFVDSTGEGFLGTAAERLGEMICSHREFIRLTHGPVARIGDDWSGYFSARCLGVITAYEQLAEERFILARTMASLRRSVGARHRAAADWYASLSRLVWKLDPSTIKFGEDIPDMSSDEALVRYPRTCA